MIYLKATRRRVPIVLRVASLGLLLIQSVTYVYALTDGTPTLTILTNGSRSRSDDPYLLHIEVWEIQIYVRF